MLTHAIRQPIIMSLRSLEYRGYDSAGIAIVKDQKTVGPA